MHIYFECRESDDQQPSPQRGDIVYAGKPGKTYVCIYVCMHVCMHVLRSDDQLPSPQLYAVKPGKAYVCIYVCMYAYACIII